MMFAYDYPLLGFFWTMLIFFLWIAWIFLPFLNERRFQWARVFITGLGVFALAYICSMTVYGYVAK